MGLTEHGPVELTPGPWWTLESFIGKVGRTTFVFRAPAGVHVKVRYGVGFLGWDSQRQLTDGQNDKRLTISGWVGRARIQAGVHQTLTLEWTRLTEGPEPLPPFSP